MRLQCPLHGHGAHGVPCRCPELQRALQAVHVVCDTAFQSPEVWLVELRTTALCPQMLVHLQQLQYVYQTDDLPFVLRPLFTCCEIRNIRDVLITCVCMYTKGVVNRLARMYMKANYSSNSLSRIIGC